MADSYDRYDSEGSGGGFMMGLLTGTVLGAGLGMLLAPKAGAELRGAIGEQARAWGSTAQEQYRHAKQAAGPWVERGRDMVNQARDAASQAAEQARSYAGQQGGATSGSTAGSNYSSSSSTGSSYSSPTTGGSDFNRTNDFNRS